MDKSERSSGAVRTITCSSKEIDDALLASLGFEDAPALVLGYVSPHIDFQETAGKIRNGLPRGTQVVLTTTAGELRSSEKTVSPYCETGASWDRVVLQSFSRSMISAVHTVAIPLGDEDIRAGKPQKPPDKRIEDITQRLRRVSVPFKIDYRDTVCYTLVDGLSNSESFFMEAVYESSAVPCLLIGGSAGGKLDFKNTYIYDGSSVKQDHAILTFIKFAEGYSFGVFTTQNFEKTDKSFVILECDVALRRIKGIFEERTLAKKPFIDSLCDALGCKTADLETKLSDYTFGIEIEGELYIRSVSSVNHEAGFVSFYCDIDAGDRLFLLKKTDFVSKTERDYGTYAKGKPVPIGGILNDCILRRLMNGKEIGALSAFKGIDAAGFSMFGELLGVNVNQTLTALFLYRTEKEDAPFHDAYIDSFLIKYSGFKSYFLKRKLARDAIIETIYRNTLSTVFSSSDMIRNLSKAFDQAISEMGGNLQGLGKIMEKLTSFSASMEMNGKENATLYSQMRSLVDRVREIEGVLATITDIAEQTGILSINAAIQAARAGDRGKGFAVVAAEVRKLSELISTNLQSIDLTTGAILKSVDSISKVVEGARNSLGTIVLESKAIHGDTVSIIEGITRTKDTLKAEDQDVKRILEYLQALRTSETVIDILMKERV
ncbi:MAG: hypothetical protein A2Z99_18305 [Treponema sp. GWB1_62_6]|nr:MAG: hypothetical protein A2Z99_18305 [Treponema sp. GWB1_62_6]